MDISTKYNPRETEDKWYSYWLKHKLFKSEPDNRPAYTIVIPPPNVTGVLHMGHMLNNTIQDIFIRRARMTGYNACWVPGTDHASIATEAKVVAKLQKEGIEKDSITREEFLKHAFEWKEKHGGIILEQLKKLGASCDWDRTSFTMDHSLSESVIAVFVDLYNKGYIYKGVRMVNWDPKAKTAISDEEVEYKEEKSKLYYVKYRVVDATYASPDGHYHHTENDTDNWLTIATTRPETILGDTAVCINPNDPRYLHLHGKKVVIPLVDRVVPIITDEYVEMEFGTGCLKITPSHDVNDYILGQKHHLPSINIFNDDGTLSANAAWYVGIDRFEARKLITADLKKLGQIVKIDDYTNKVGYSQRSVVPIEPRLSTQWFLKMPTLAKPALDNVMNDTIRFYPEKFKNIYKHWMENVNDWCISRQLWWGHRIPAYYLPNGEFVVAQTIEEAIELAKQKTGDQNLSSKDLQQDNDVLDTWFSSWLWPISVFDGIRYPDNKDITYYYPTNLLATGHDIIFFWVARMIIAGYEYRGNYPFKDVYFTGMVRDGQGRKMSKQLGNSPEPIKMIEDYGADGVRVGMLLCSPAGGDLLFDIEVDKQGNQTYPLVEQGRNFANKIWNAFRLVSGWKSDTTIAQPVASQQAVTWFEARINQTIASINQLFDSYRLSEALMTVYKLFWDDFAAWYLEIIKPGYELPIDHKTYLLTIDFFDRMLRLLHPFMPFITEELWHKLATRQEGESITTAQMPESQNFDVLTISQFEHAQLVVAEIRRIRAEKNISPKETLTLKYRSSDSDINFEAVVIKLTNLTGIESVTQKVEGDAPFIVGTTEYFVPVGDLIDVEAEYDRLTKELQRAKSLLAQVDQKLANTRFVANAPKQVLEMEQKKQSDSQMRINAIEEQIAALKR